MGKLTALSIIVIGFGANYLPDVFYAGRSPRLLVTFLGLIAASILPTISLAIGSMAADGLSVKGIDLLP